MAAQDVRELVPRVRRAVEGPRALGSGGLTDEELLAMAADAIADIILLSAGQWPHKLAVSGRVEQEGEEDGEGTGAADEWTVEPALEPEEETLVAAQAALSYVFVGIQDFKTSERIVAEGREHEWTVSATAMRDHVKFLQDQRDAALAALARRTPALARYESILAVRDALGAAQLEPWVNGGLGGGQALLPYA